MTAPTFATLARQLAIPGRLTREVVGFAVTVLCRDGYGFIDALEAIADGQVDLSRFLGNPPVERSTRTLRRHAEQWRDRAWRTREPDLRVQILRALGLPEDRIAEVMQMFPLAEITLGDVAATEAVGKRSRSQASVAKNPHYLATTSAANDGIDWSQTQTDTAPLSTPEHAR